MTVRALFSFTALAALTAVSAFGASARVGTARIPFAFRAGSTTMPAGNYDIEAPQGRGVPLITFRNVDTGDATMILAPVALSPNQSVDPANARVDFVCAGTECAFYRIWPAGSTGGWAMNRPKFKDELGQTIAPNETFIAAVAIAPGKSSAVKAD